MVLPATATCDLALAEIDKAAAALRAGKRDDAGTHQKNIVDLLRRISGAISSASGPLEYIPDKSYQMAQGRPFYPWKFEAVIGSEVAERTDLKLGSMFHATHGNPGPNDPKDVHPELWKIVGVMKRTHTAADRCLYIPLISFYTIAEHEKGLQSHAQVPAGRRWSAATTIRPNINSFMGMTCFPIYPTQRTSSVLIFLPRSGKCRPSWFSPAEASPVTILSTSFRTAGFPVCKQ